MHCLLPSDTVSKPQNDTIFCTFVCLYQTWNFPCDIMLIDFFDILNLDKNSVWFTDKNKINSAIFESQLQMTVMHLEYLSLEKPYVKVVVRLKVF